MDRTFTVYRRLATEHRAEQVLAAVEHSLRSTVGGSIRRDQNTFYVTNGTNNLNFAFVGDLSAVITLTQPSPGIVDVNGTITLKPNGVFWICAVAGLCIIFSWGINLMYFILDPRNNYQMALDRIDVLPNTGPAPPPKPYGA